MTPLATIELQLPGSERSGRAFLQRSVLPTVTVEALERRLAEVFLEPEDAPRLDRIERVLRGSDVVQVAVYPGESPPPEYHAYLRDPASPEEPLFACVLATPPVLSELLAEPPHILFETATFQAMSADSSPAGMLAAFEAWVGRLWPALLMPRVELRPWPVEQVHSQRPAAPIAGGRVVPRGAPSRLRYTDYPTPEELSA
jgi:hypothetical protein